MSRIVIGAVIGVFGLLGEMKVLPLVEDANIFRRLKNCVLSGAGERKVLSVKPYKDGWRMLLEGIDNPEDAATFRGAEISMYRESLPPAADDEVYWHDIVGAQVIDELGNRVGTLVDYMETGAHDVFLIESDDGREYLISNNPVHISDINAKAGIVTVERIGLVEQN